VKYGPICQKDPLLMVSRVPTHERGCQTREIVKKTRFRTLFLGCQNRPVYPLKIEKEKAVFRPIMQ